MAIYLGPCWLHFLASLPLSRWCALDYMYTCLSCSTFSARAARKSYILNYCALQYMLLLPCGMRIGTLLRQEAFKFFRFGGYLSPREKEKQIILCNEWGRRTVWICVWEIWRKVVCFVLRYFPGIWLERPRKKRTNFGRSTCTWCNKWSFSERRQMSRVGKSSLVSHVSVLSWELTSRSRRFLSLSEKSVIWHPWVHCRFYCHVY